MKLKKVLFTDTVRLKHGKNTRIATIEDAQGWGADYIELQDRIVIVHKNHESTCVPLENVTSFETLNEPAVSEFKKEAAKDEPQKRKQGERAIPKKNSKAKRKTSTIRAV
jgi:hypothetical protein|tara:strand:+ start:845 stop:1174 length:330 start_codon:yes stop_codon:yes gene_type:complete